MKPRNSIRFRACALVIVSFIIIGLVILVARPNLGAAARSRHPGRSGGDLELLARLIGAEAGAEPFLGKVAVAAVLLNRVQNPRFPKTVAGVIYQPHAFESVSNGQINKPATSACHKAAQAALSGWDPSGGALFFFNPAKVVGPSYVWTRRIIQKIGKHVFAL